MQCARLGSLRNSVGLVQQGGEGSEEGREDLELWNRTVTGLGVIPAPQGQPFVGPKAALGWSPPHHPTPPRLSSPVPQGCRGKKGRTWQVGLSSAQYLQAADSGPSLTPASWPSQSSLSLLALRAGPWDIIPHSTLLVGIPSSSSHNCLLHEAVRYRESQRRGHCTQAVLSYGTRGVLGHCRWLAQCPSLHGCWVLPEPLAPLAPVGLHRLPANPKAAPCRAAVCDRLKGL